MQRTTKEEMDAMLAVGQTAKRYTDCDGYLQGIAERHYANDIGQKTQVGIGQKQITWIVLEDDLVYCTVF